MYTKSMRGAAAAVSGARHTRIGRNGQDAAASWIGDRIGAVVVCDGCGSGASSEVGARLGAQFVIAAIERRVADASLAADVDARFTGVWVEPDVADIWLGVRADVVAHLDALVRAMPGAREIAIRDYFLFTIVAAIVVDDVIHVWAIGDGAYAIDGVTRELGPFSDNQPPYIAYDLLAMPATAHVETAHGECVVVATDGVAEIGLERFARGCDRFVAHPDALRRQLAVLARSEERVDWDGRRVVRIPAALQDDGAVAMLVTRRAQ